MLVDTARDIARAYARGELDLARAGQSKLQHYRHRGSRRSICGLRMARSGGGGNVCRRCLRMLDNARDAA